MILHTHELFLFQTTHELCICVFEICGSLMNGDTTLSSMKAWSRMLCSVWEVAVQGTQSVHSYCPWKLQYGCATGYKMAFVVRHQWSSLSVCQRQSPFPADIHTCTYIIIYYACLKTAYDWYFHVWFIPYQFGQCQCDWEDYKVIYCKGWTAILDW